MTTVHVLHVNGTPHLLADAPPKPRPCSHLYQLRVGDRFVCVCQLGTVSDRTGDAR